MKCCFQLNHVSSPKGPWEATSSPLYWAMWGRLVNFRGAVLPVRSQRIVDLDFKLEKLYVLIRFTTFSIDIRHLAFQPEALFVFFFFFFLFFLMLFL